MASSPPPSPDARAARGDSPVRLVPPTPATTDTTTAPPAGAPPRDAPARDASAAPVRKAASAGAARREAASGRGASGGRVLDLLVGRDAGRGARLLVATACGVVTVALTVAVGRRLDVYPMTLLLAAVVASATFGGFAAGLLTAALCVAGVALLLAPPIGSFAMDRPEDWWRVALFVVAAALASAFATAVRRARARADALAARLAAQAAALAAANGQLAEQQRELEATNAQLQDQHVELEAQQASLEEQAAELEAQADAMREATVALEAALARERATGARLARLVESGIVGVFSWHLDGGIVEANDAFLQMLGYTPDDLRAGRVDWRRMTPARWAAGDAAQVEVLLATGRHAPYDKEYLAADGTPVPVTVASAFLDPSPDRAAPVGVSVCVDRRAQAAAEAARERLLVESEAARHEADAANAAKSAFLANMSHELRTPLNAIGGYAQLIEMEIHGPVTEAQRGALVRLQAAQQRLLARINDVLDFAKLEHGKVEYDVRAVDVRAVVAEAVPLVEPQAHAKGLALDVELPDGPCPVWADRERLGQVLVNLLANAVKFTERRHPQSGAPGRVCVRLATRAPALGPASASASASASAAPDVVFVQVRDTGCGIPPDRQAQVFEPFVQVRSREPRSFAQATEGTGLGLAISRELARGMGGDLRLRSVEGEGTTFTVTLRRAPAADGARAAG